MTRLIPIVGMLAAFAAGGIAAAISQPAPAASRTAAAVLNGKRADGTSWGFVASDAAGAGDFLSQTVAVVPAGTTIHFAPPAGERLTRLMLHAGTGSAFTVILGEANLETLDPADIPNITFLGGLSLGDGDWMNLRVKNAAPGQLCGTSDAISLYGSGSCDVAATYDPR